MRYIIARRVEKKLHEAAADVTEAALLLSESADRNLPFTQSQADPVLRPELVARIGAQVQRIACLREYLSHLLFTRDVVPHDIGGNEQWEARSCHVWAYEVAHNAGAFDCARWLVGEVDSVWWINERDRKRMNNEAMLGWDA